MRLIPSPVRRIETKKLLWFISPFAIAIPCLLFLLFPGEAQAVMLKLSIDELTGEADSIVVGTVIERTSHWNHDRTMIYTTIVVSLEEQVKSHPETAGRNTITLTVPGGEVDGVSVYISDMPGFRVGERAVLFLKQVSGEVVSGVHIKGAQLSGAQFEVYGKFQGKLSVKDGKVGKLNLAEVKQKINNAAQSKKLQSSGIFSTKEYFSDQSVTDGTQPLIMNFSYFGLKWPNRCPTINYRINENSSSCTGEGAAIKAAADTWNDVPDTCFSFSYAGATTVVESSDPRNNINEILWNDLGPNNTLAHTIIWYDPYSNTVLENDVEFNTYHPWSTASPPPAGQFDVQTVALHEFGHWFVLNDLYDSADASKVMYGYASSGNTKRVLTADDQAGMQFVYPSAPNLISPTNGFVASGTSLNFNWSAVAGADRYHIYIATSPSFGTTNKYHGVVYGTTFSDSGYPNNGAPYWWCVYAGNSAGYGPQSATWSFVNGKPTIAPTLTSPANGTAIPGTSVNYSWNPVPGADRYHIYIATSTSFGTTNKYHGIVYGTSFSDTGYPNNNTPYYWCVYAGNSAGFGPRSANWSFNNGKPTIAPTLTSPANGTAIPGTSVNYSWNAVPGADRYHIYIATSTSFGATIKYDGMVYGTSFLHTGYLNNNTTYYWLVYPGNSAGNGPKSATWSFNNGKPTASPTLISPGDGSTVTGNSVNYTWSAVPGADRYHIYIATSRSFGATIKYDGMVYGTSFLDTGYLNNGTTYYWLVYPGNSAGNGPKSATWSFVNGPGP